MNPAAPKLQPALFGGLFIGVLSALPIINIANCCCLWVIGGGVLATYLMQLSPTLKKRRNLDGWSTGGRAAPLTGRPAASSV
jgi:hypothetical protein